MASPDKAFECVRLLLGVNNLLTCSWQVAYALITLFISSYCCWQIRAFYMYCFSNLYVYKNLVFDRSVVFNCIRSVVNSKGFNNMSCPTCSDLFDSTQISDVACHAWSISLAWIPPLESLDTTRTTGDWISQLGGGLPCQCVLSPHSEYHFRKTMKGKGNSKRSHKSDHGETS